MSALPDLGLYYIDRKLGIQEKTDGKKTPCGCSGKRPKRGVPGVL